MMLTLLGECHPDCPWCAREWFRWLAARMRQMQKPARGERISFAEAAASSVRADAPTA